MRPATRLPRLSRLSDPNRKFTLHVLTMLEPSVVGPLDPSGEPVRRWLMVSDKAESTVSTEQLLSVFNVPSDFLRKLAAVVPRQPPPTATALERMRHRLDRLQG
jgi:hypothetical protein